MNKENSESIKVSKVKKAFDFSAIASTAKKVIAFLNPIPQHSEDYRYIVFRLILLFVAAFLIVGNWYLFDTRRDYRVGYPSPKTYFAITTTRYEDKPATLELRQRAASRIVDVMTQDSNIAAEVSWRFDNLKKGNEAEILNPELLKIYQQRSEASKTKIADEAVKIGTKISEQARTREEQSSLIWSSLQNVNLSQADKNVVYQILDAILTPSVQRDPQLTARLREDIASQIPTVVIDIKPGSVLIQKGQLVTPSLAQLLAHHGYSDASFPLKRLVFVLLSILVWSYWPIWLEGMLMQRLSYQEWMYIGTTISLTWFLEVLASRLTGEYPMAVLALTGWLCMTLPVSIAYHVVWGGGMIGILIAYGSIPNMVALGFAAVAFSASLGRVFFVSPTNRRGAIWTELFMLGVLLSAVTSFVYWGLGIMEYGYRQPLYSIAFAAVWGAIVIVVLPIWENLFDVHSPLRLLELCDQSQPLLRRLQMEAPGTYHHTLMVGSLAETAANKLGLNGLLIRAGAYYHDIGKLKNPNYFVENQTDGVNPHDDISPTISANIIISHVKDGLDIAAQNKLSKSLMRFIAEHHGTTVQHYFYQKSIALGENTPIETFTYAGPKPQSIETAIVMLADSVEAAVKAKRSVCDNADELSDFVYSVIKSKIDAGQMDNIDLTFRDISTIRSSFVDVLLSTYKSREVRSIDEVIKNFKENNERSNAVNNKQQ